MCVCIVTYEVHVGLERVGAVDVPQLLHEAVGGLHGARHGARQVVLPLGLAQALKRGQVLHFHLLLLGRARHLLHLQRQVLVSVCVRRAPHLLLFLCS